MKIEKKDFYKLKQLDRIEYRQRKQYIEEQTNCGSLNYIYFIGIISFMCIISSLIIYSIDGAIHYEILGALISVGNFGSALVVICVIIEVIIRIIGTLIQNKKLNELNEEYFKIKVKK